MVNRERFMLNLDSEGFPVSPPLQSVEQLAAVRYSNIGRTLDHAVPQALLADHKCIACEPVDLRNLLEDERMNEALKSEGINPEGWREVDGVKLPPITWADFGTLANGSKVPAQADYTATEQRIAQHMGITRLSDSYAPDAFFGHKR